MTVAEVQTDGAGRFAVPLDAAAVGPRHTHAWGGIDLDIVVTEGDDLAVWSFTATPSTRQEQDRGASHWANDGIEPATAATRMDEHKAPTHLLIDLGAETVVEQGSDLDAQQSDDE
jgi:hypothetical protein